MERAPLLGNIVGQRDEGQASGGEHPIFLRVAHSPWRLLNQNALGYIRGVILTYMIGTSLMLINYKVKHREDEHTKWRIPFQFSTVTWFLLLLYHVMAFSWTITHMHWPDIDASDTRWESRLLRFMSPPEQRPDSRRRLYFSLFYTVTHVFALMNVVIYWAVMVPKGHDHWPSKGGHGDDSGGGFFVIIKDLEDSSPVKGILAQGWFPAFCLFNLYVFPALITVIETTVLNSMKRPEPVPSHFFGTIFSAGLYLAYGGIGSRATGHSPFFWMSEDKLGSKEKVTGYCVGFLVLSGAMFSMLYGLIGMRETVSEKRRSH